MPTDDTFIGELAPASEYTEREQREMRRQIEAMPEWKKYWPKEYRPYKGHLYPNAKDIGHTLLNIAKKIEFGYYGESERYEIMWASTLAERKLPVFWVAPDIVAAVMNTTPPITLDWYNWSLPYEGIAFVLPTGSIVHPKDGNINYISYFRAKKGRWIKSLADFGPGQYSSENGSFCVLAKSVRYLMHFNMPYEHYPTVDLKSIDEAVSRFEHHNHSSGWLDSPKLDRNDTLVGIEAAHLIFGLLLLMTRKPELITNGVLEKKVKGKRGEIDREYWSPPVIGENYRVKRVTRRLGGTHASPRAHWVRGFWREQHYGVGRSSVKEVWIEPYERGWEDEQA